MKKLGLAFLTIALAFVCVGLFSDRNIQIQASGTQQSTEAVDVSLTTFFDTDNTIETTFSLPENGDRWFDEAQNKLFTFVTDAWDAGTVLPVTQPESPVEGNQWFNEATNKLFTYGETWDAGVVLPTRNPSLTYGQKLSFATDLADSTGYTFLYWEVNGSIRDLPIDYEFTLAKTNNLKAVFSPSDKHAVTFVDSNGKILKVEYVSDQGTATAPVTLPSKPGYSTNGWNVSLENIETDTIAVLQYTKTNVSNYLISVVNGTGGGEIEYNTTATLVADASETLYFHHWEIAGQTVSYSSTYSFTVLKAETVTAYYAASAPTPQPKVLMSNNLGIRAGYESYLGQFYLPEGYTIVEYGFLTHDSAQGLMDINTSGATRHPATKYNTTTKEFLMSFVDTVTSVRAYMVCLDAEDDLVTVYSESAYSVINGGFETGNLNGWNPYNIWKNESGIAAYVGQDSRAVSDTYFGSNPYNRDGSYNLGIVWSGATWEQSAERMGHLRSSNFILGGTGWISFKLGGGRTSSLAYVSVRKTEDHTEVARFGNRHFNNTSIASTQYGSSISNAEAFMFQYYYDLSSYLGENLYFVISDTASFDWCILSADSFITYYEIAPTTSEDTLATNIVPSILGIETATNQIVNGYPFITDLADWTNVDGKFRLDNSGARSDIGGDSAIGVLRSSAFHINGDYKYLRFDWAGGLKYDKQIFISVKEIGTNIEVIRIVRRDNLSGKESNDFDNHMVDLSGLDSNKLYYLEVADNRAGGWGFTHVRSVRLRGVDQWNSVPVGDRAVVVSGLVTNFNYTYIDPTT